jgi:hypothetical protein
LEVLELARGGRSSILKPYMTLLLKYRAYQQLVQSQPEVAELQSERIEAIISESIEQEVRVKNGKP